MAESSYVNEKWKPIGRREWWSAIIHTLKHARSLNSYRYTLIGLMTSPREFIKTLYATRRCLETCTKYDLIKIPVWGLDFYFDEHTVTNSDTYRNAIEELVAIPPHHLTQQDFTRILGYEMVETYHNMVLKGHWKVRALWETNHEMFQIRVKARSL